MRLSVHALETRAVPAAPVESLPVLPDLSGEVLANVRTIAAAGRAAGLRSDVFIKLGDSNTADPHFLEGLGLTTIPTAGTAGLTAADVATVARYAAPVGFGNSFTRTSTAAIRDFYLPGLTGFAAGEVSATRASVAVIMIGTNDTAFTPFGQFGGRRHRRRRAGRDRGRGGGGRCPAGAGVPHRRHFAARLLCLRFRAANRRDRGCRR